MSSPERCELCGAVKDPRKRDDDLHFSAATEIIRCLVYIGIGAVLGLVMGLGV